MICLLYELTRGIPSFFLYTFNILVFCVFVFCCEVKNEENPSLFLLLVVCGMLALFFVLFRFIASILSYFLLLRIKKKRVASGWLLLLLLLLLVGVDEEALGTKDDGDRCENAVQDQAQQQRVQGQKYTNRPTEDRPFLYISE